MAIETATNDTATTKSTPAHAVKLPRRFVQLAERSSTQKSTFRLLQWNTLADGLSQNGGFVTVRTEEAFVPTLFFYSYLCEREHPHPFLTLRTKLSFNAGNSAHRQLLWCTHIMARAMGYTHDGKIKDI